MCYNESVPYRGSSGCPIGDNAKQFMRIGKRFIVNMNYIYQVDIQKQTLMLSDCEHFLFQMPVSKEALKTVKELVIRTKI